MDLIKPMLDLKVPTGLQLSPDGRFVAYSTSGKSGLQEGESPSSPIWIANVGQQNSARLIASGFHDRSLVWSPDSQSIAFISDRGKPGKAHAIYLLTPGDSQEPKALTPAEGEGRITDISFSPDGKWIAFTGAPEKSAERRAKDDAKDDAHVWDEDWEYAHLYLVEVATGAVKPLFTEQRHVDGFAWSDDGTRIAVATHRSPHIESPHTDGVDVFVVDVDGSRTDKLSNVPEKVKSLVWVGSSLYFIGYFELEDDTSGDAVFTIDLANGQYLPQRVAHGVDDNPLKLIKIGRDVVVSVQKGPEDQLRILNGKTLFAQKKWTHDFGVAAGQDGGIVLVTAHDDVNHPTEVFSTNVSDGVSTQLSDHGSAFPNKDLGVVTFLECPSFDGKEQIDGLIITPSQFAGPGGKPARPLPTYVAVHGGPFYRQTDCFDALDNFHLYKPSLLAKGYAVLIPNYRGSSGRGSRYSSYSRGGMGVYDEPDVVAMTQHAIEQGFADKSKLVIGGWSQGGYLSYLSAVRNGKHGLGWRFNGAIPGAGVADWDSMSLTSDIGYCQAATAGGEMWRMDKNEVNTRSGSALWEFKEAVQEGRIPALLILHGEADVRIHVSQAWGFRRALVKAGLPFELVTYPREGHRFSERKHIEDLITRVLRFVDVHLS